MIVCRNLVKSFPGQEILHGFSYTFADHGFYLLLGESGSGKTTFLNVLSGFLPFEGGTVCWGDRAFTGRVNSREIEGELDYITQDSFFADFLSVTDNLRLIRDDRERIAALLERFGLSDKAGRLTAVLSGGEKQRLAIARALLNGKKVLFFDEPTASLDEENKAAIFELLADLKKSVLIVCSSHDAMAKEYADAVIPFTKIREDGKAGAGDADTADSGRRAVKRVKKRAEKAKKTERPAVRPKKAGLTGFLIRYFRSGQRSRKSTVLLTVFLVLASCICLLADLPEHKVEACIANLYGTNMLTVQTFGRKTRWSDIDPGGDGVRAAVLDYSGSCPDGNEDLPDDAVMRPLPDYEVSLEILPFERELFLLSDRLACGSYFTERDQIILSWEMASYMMPENPEHLIGKHITKNLYGLGQVDFEIVGIFDSFNDFEKQYLRAAGVDMAIGEAYNPRNYRDLFFANSEITDELEADDAFFMNDQRSYHLYFDSYKEMKAYFDRYGAGLNAPDNGRAFYNRVDIQMEFAFETMAVVLLPVAAFMVIFSTLFAVLLKKTEFVYNNRFISVFEYSGYDKKRVICRFTLLHLLDLCKTLLISEAAAFLLTRTANLLNRRFIWLPYEIFTYNPWLILAFNAVVPAVSAAAFRLLFRRVRVSSWYENLIAGRDLL